MITTINNEFISISVKSKGAELCSLKTLHNSKEYIWQADAKYWGKHSPILFPIVGCLKDNEYIYEGITYNLPRHGFARELEFDLIESEHQKLVFSLSYNEETLKVYPFKFQLLLIYEIKDKTLDITYKVINHDDKKLFFSIGGHPAFNCNIADGHQYLEFEEKMTLESRVVDCETGLIENGRKFIQGNNDRLLLSYDLFKQDALVFDSPDMNSISIIDDIANDSLKVTFKGFPYVGIWTPSTTCAPFVCIEPWYGIADSVDANKKLEDKIGIRVLDQNSEFTCSYQIELN